MLLPQNPCNLKKESGKPIHCQNKNRTHNPYNSERCPSWFNKRFASGKQKPSKKAECCNHMKKDCGNQTSIWQSSDGHCIALNLIIRYSRMCKVCKKSYGKTAPA